MPTKERFLKPPWFLLVFSQLQSCIKSFGLPIYITITNVVTLFRFSK